MYMQCTIYYIEDKQFCALSNCHRVTCIAIDTVHETRDGTNVLAFYIQMLMSHFKHSVTSYRIGNIFRRENFSRILRLRKNYTQKTKFYMFHTLFLTNSRKFNPAKYTTYTVTCNTSINNKQTITKVIFYQKVSCCTSY